MPEMVLYGVILAGGMALLVRFDVFDTIYTFTRSHESYQLDEFLLSLPLLLVCATVFSVLRLVELKRQRSALEASRDELSQAYEKLDGLSRYRERFLLRACHELKRPVWSAAEYIRQMTPSKESRDRAAASDANNSLESLLCLMDDLAACTLEEGRGTGEQRILNIPDLLESVRLLCQGQADAKGVSLHVTHENMPSEIISSANYLRLVLLALIGNGIKHTESGRVAVHCCLSRRDGSAMQLTVSDTGKGVIETDLDKIFDPHESCGDLPTSLKDCLGIGLPLVQRLVEENGGGITVASTPGLGTEFVLTIPVATHAR